MNTILEEIRERIKNRMAILGVIRDDDEYANGQSVSLAIALRIIDEVEKEYFVPTEEGKTLQKLREFLATATPEELEAKYRELEYLLAPKDEDANKAAEEACAKCPISGRCFVEDKGRKDACDYLRGVEAGIAWERERKMQRVGEEWGDKVAEKPEIIFSTDGELTVYSFVGAPRWWATIREAEEALSVFKAGAGWQAAKDGECHEESFEEGAKWQRERLLARAIKANIFDVEDGSDAAKLIVRIPGAKVGDEVEIIIKKEK